MELSWLMKIRLAAAFAVGIVLIGILAWPIARPPELYAVISLTTGSISQSGIMILAGLSVVTGFAAYFLCWPYGREIGIFAVPAGLAIWAMRTGSVANLIQANPMLSQRQAIYAGFKWEPFFWLAIVALGFTGVFIGRLIYEPQSKPAGPDKKAEPKLNVYLRMTIAFIASILIAQICIRIFARDVSLFTRNFGSAVSQPSTGQIVLAVVISFAIAGFVVKKFLEVGFIFPILAASFVTLLAAYLSVSRGSLARMVQYWPANFFNNAVFSILPIQLVAFGTIGAVAGYWMAVRFEYWQKYEIGDTED